MPRTSLLVTLFSACILFAACTPSDAPESAEPSQTETSETAEREIETILKLRIYLDGRITIDDEAVSVEQLENSITALDPETSAVWFYREEEGAARPRLVAMQALNMIIDQNLQLCLSSMEDFADCPDSENG